VPEVAARPGGDQPVPLTYEQDRHYGRSLRSTWPHRNVRVCFRIEGPVDLEAFGEAVRAFAFRHDALQMKPVAGDSGPPAQRIDPLDPADPIVTSQRLGASSVDQFSRYVEAVFTRDVRKPWADDGERPFTFRVFQLDEQHHAFLATFQRVVFDGKSHELFSREVWRNYHLLRHGQPIPGPADSFADAAVRQRARFGPEHKQRAKALWRERVEFLTENRWTTPVAPTPPTDHDLVGSVVDSEVTARLRESCRQNRCTPLQWITSSFVASVAEQTGRTGVGFWTTINSRTAADRDVVGTFTAACPLVITDARADRYAVLQQTREAIINSIRYAQLDWRDLEEVMTGFADPAVPGFEDIYVNLLQFDAGYGQPAAEEPDLRVTADAYPPRGLRLLSNPALHLRCEEFRDLIQIKILFNGERAGRPVAQAVLDGMMHDIAALVFATRHH
jgi:Condensation domain